MQAHAARMREAVQNLFTPEQIDSLISIWSMRPPPVSEQGKAWEQGARWAWGQAESHADAALHSPAVRSSWIDVEEEMPPNGRRVMFTWMNSLGKRRTSIGRYVAARTVEEYDEETNGTTNDYDEATDTYYAHAGWHEMPVESEHYYPVADKVTHWQPIPETPEADSVRRTTLETVAEGATATVAEGASAAPQADASESTLDMQALQKELFLSSMKDVFRFTRDELIQLLGRRFLLEGVTLRGADPAHPSMPDEPEYVVVPTEPDVALLASMATCLNHGFGLMGNDEQGHQIYEMHKVYDEVVGKGYYRYSVRSRYTDWLAKEHGGTREQEPQSALFGKPKDEV
jgi:hypothetical protein